MTDLINELREERDRLKERVGDMIDERAGLMADRDRLRAEVARQAAVIVELEHQRQTATAEIDRLDAIRRALEAERENGIRTVSAEVLARLEADNLDLIAKLQRVNAANDQLRDDFCCIRCGDGHTPLYCLNCASVLLSPAAPKEKQP